MMTLSNIFSLIRAPLALLFLQANPFLRLLAILLAAISDSVDGYLARKYRTTTQFGAVLDPLMDKFFVYFALITLFQEGSLSLLELQAMLSRDFGVCLYALYIAFRGRIKSVVFRSVRFGKATTFLQFLFLGALVLNYPFPSIALIIFTTMGAMAFIELIYTTNDTNASRISS